MVELLFVQIIANRSENSKRASQVSRGQVSILDKREEEWKDVAD